MTILFVTRILHNGGAERVVSVLSNHLSYRGHRVIVYVFNRTENDYKIEKDVIIKEPIVGYSEDKGNALTRTYSRIKGIRDVIKEYEPDVVIPFLYGPLRDSIFAALGTEVSIIGTIRNLPKYNSIWQKIMHELLLSNCKAVMFQTYDQKMLFNKNIRNKGFVLNNPVNENFMVKTFSNEQDLLNNYKIVTFGRLHKQKNHLLLIQAMAEVHKRHKDIELDIYGEGKERNALQAEIEKENATQYIHIKGFVNDIQNKMLEARAFVLSSDYEGMPNALIEAMAFGLPCISTDCRTGPRELLGKNERGVLVEVGNVNQLSDAICRILEDENLSLTYGRIAREYVLQNLTPDKICNQLEDELEKIKQNR